MKKSELNKLVKEYKDNFNYLWVKEHETAEELAKYLLDKKLVIKSIKIESKYNVNEWGFVVRDTAI